MAEKRSDDITELSPDNLLTTFTKKSLTQFMLLAVAIHIVVILVTSLGTFKAMAMGAAEEPTEEATEQAAPEQASAPAQNAQQANAPAAPGAGDAGQAQGAKGAPAKGEGEKGNAYVEQLRETIPPDQAPTDSNLGISLEDTSF